MKEENNTDYGLGTMGNYIDMIPGGIAYRLFDTPNEIGKINGKWSNQYTMGLVKFKNEIFVLLKSSGSIQPEDVAMVEFNVIKDLIEKEMSKVILDNDYVDKS